METPSRQDPSLEGQPHFANGGDQVAIMAAQLERAVRQATSESGFVLHAKTVAEEHSLAIAQLRGSAEADIAWVASIKQQVEQARQAIAEVRRDAEADQSISNTSREKVESIRESAEAVDRAVQELAPLLDRSKRDVQQSVQDVGVALNTVRQFQEDASKAVGEVKKTCVDVQKWADAALEENQRAEAAAKQTESHAVVVNALADLADKSLNNVLTYEARLAELADSFVAVERKIEGLLPNATSAGLASAFRNQKQRLHAPQRWWLFAFVAALLGLLTSAFVGIPPSSESWDAILRHLVNRLPLVVPLVWMAIYSARHYTMVVRVQEEYAFKEALSTAFEGYKREMASIGADSPPGAPLLTLCQDVLTALSERPGRIYDANHHDVTPLTPLLTALKDGLGQVTEAMTGVGKGSTAP